MKAVIWDLTNPRRNPQNILSLLTSKGMNVENVKEVIPNVEDIFISKLAK